MYALTAIVYGYLSPDAIDHIQEGEEEGEKNEGVEKVPTLRSYWMVIGGG